MARQRSGGSGAGSPSNGGWLARILRAIGMAPEEPPPGRRTCWQWEFNCWLEDENGNHMFYGTYKPVTDNKDDYQTAYMRSRREMWREASAAYPNRFTRMSEWQFRCRKQGQPRAVPC